MNYNRKNIQRKKKHSLSPLPRSGTDSKAFFRAEAQKGNFVVKIDTKKNEKERTEKVAVSRNGATYRNRTFLKHAFALIEKRKGYTVILGLAMIQGFADAKRGDDQDVLRKAMLKT